MIHRNDKTFMCSIQVLISKWAKIWEKIRASFEAFKGIKKNHGYFKQKGMA